jgi:hypothetical protein
MSKGKTTMTYIPAHLVKWTRPANYGGADWPDYYSFGFGRSRDSDALERSNFRCALAAVGGESKTVAVVRESHWAVGWVEWIAIHESDAETLRAADAVRARYADYPVIDEDDFAREEMTEANEIWRTCYTPFARIRYIRVHQHQFDFANYRDMLGCVRGDFFAGYASELL